MAQEIEAGKKSDRRHPLVALGYLAVDWWPGTLATIGALLLVVPELTNAKGQLTELPGHPGRAVIFVVAALVFVVGQGAQGLRQRRMSALQDEVLRMRADAHDRAAAISGLARIELALLAEELGYASDERISLLAIDGGEAVLVARFSHRPTFEAHGRGRYPLDEGVIREAYEIGLGAILDLPDPVTNLRDWRREMRSRCGIPAETANGLVMRSRTAVAIRIRQGGPGGDALGFLVFESLHAAADSRARCILDPEELQKRVAHPHGERFQGLLDVVCRLGVVGSMES